MGRRLRMTTELGDWLTGLAVLEGPESISEHGAEATRLAGGLLTEIRDDGWPADLAEVLLAGQAEFLARFFPADDGSIVRRAQVLAAMTQLRRQGPPPHGA